MSKIETNTIAPSTGTTLTLGESGDTVNLGSGVSSGFGKILQAVTTNKTSSFSTTSTSFVEVTGLNVSITPGSTSNKILIMSSFSLGQFGGSTSAHITLYRDSTNLGNSSNGMNEIYNSVSGNFSCGSGVVYLDSPSSTSSVTYTIYARTGSGTAYVGNNSETSTITVMEVAG